MSVWTHVAGIVRVDGIVCFGDIDFDKVFGKECLWNSNDDIWNDANLNPNDYMPMGSEGSLEKSVWINPDAYCMARYTVSVFGDLRDYDDSKAIIEWFENSCDKVAVRQAVLTIEVEGKEPITYNYCNHKKHRKEN